MAQLRSIKQRSIEQRRVGVSTKFVKATKGQLFEQEKEKKQQAFQLDEQFKTLPFKTVSQAKQQLQNISPEVRKFMTTSIQIIENQQQNREKEIQNKLANTQRKLENVEKGKSESDRIDQAGYKARLKSYVDDLNKLRGGQIIPIKEILDRGLEAKVEARAIVRGKQKERKKREKQFKTVRVDVPQKILSKLGVKSSLIQKETNPLLREVKKVGLTTAFKSSPLSILNISGRQKYIRKFSPTTEAGIIGISAVEAGVSPIEIAKAKSVDEIQNKTQSKIFKQNFEYAKKVGMPSREIIPFVEEKKPNLDKKINTNIEFTKRINKFVQRQEQKIRDKGKAINKNLFDIAVEIRNFYDKTGQQKKVIVGGVTFFTTEEKEKIIKEKELKRISEREQNNFKRKFGTPQRPKNTREYLSTLGKISSSPTTSLLLGLVVSDTRRIDKRRISGMDNNWSHRIGVSFLKSLQRASRLEEIKPKGKTTKEKLGRFFLTIGDIIGGTITRTMGSKFLYIKEQQIQNRAKEYQKALEKGKDIDIIKARINLDNEINKRIALGGREAERAFNTEPLKFWTPDTIQTAVLISLPVLLEGLGIGALAGGVKLTLKNIMGSQGIKTIVRNLTKYGVQIFSKATKGGLTILGVGLTGKQAFATIKNPTAENIANSVVVGGFFSGGLIKSVFKGKGFKVKNLDSNLNSKTNLKTRSQGITITSKGELINGLPLNQITKLRYTPKTNRIMGETKITIGKNTKTVKLNLIDKGKYYFDPKTKLRIPKKVVEGQATFKISETTLKNIKLEKGKFTTDVESVKIKGVVKKGKKVGEVIQVKKAKVEVLPVGEKLLFSKSIRTQKKITSKTRNLLSQKRISLTRLKNYLRESNDIFGWRAKVDINTKINNWTSVIKAIGKTKLKKKTVSKKEVGDFLLKLGFEKKFVEVILPKLVFLGKLRPTRRVLPKVRKTKGVIKKREGVARVRAEERLGRKELRAEEKRLKKTTKKAVKKEKEKELTLKRREKTIDKFLKDVKFSYMSPLKSFLTQKNVFGFFITKMTTKGIPISKIKINLKLLFSDIKRKTLFHEFLHKQDLSIASKIIRQNIKNEIIYKELIRKRARLIESIWKKRNPQEFNKISKRIKNIYSEKRYNEELLQWYSTNNINKILIPRTKLDSYVRKLLTSRNTDKNLNELYSLLGGKTKALGGIVRKGKLISKPIPKINFNKKFEKSDLGILKKLPKTKREGIFKDDYFKIPTKIEFPQIKIRIKNLLKIRTFFKLQTSLALKGAILGLSKKLITQNFLEGQKFLQNLKNIPQFKTAIKELIIQTPKPEVAIKTAVKTISKVKQPQVLRGIRVVRVTTPPKITRYLLTPRLPFKPPIPIFIPTFEVENFLKKNKNRNAIIYAKVGTPKRTKEEIVKIVTDLSYPEAVKKSLDIGDRYNLRSVIAVPGNKKVKGKTTSIKNLIRKYRVKRLPVKSNALLFIEQRKYFNDTRTGGKPESKLYLKKLIKVKKTNGKTFVFKNGKKKQTKPKKKVIKSKLKVNKKRVKKVAGKKKISKGKKSNVSKKKITKKKVFGKRSTTKKKVVKGKPKTKRKVMKRRKR